MKRAKGGDTAYTRAPDGSGAIARVMHTSLGWRLCYDLDQMVVDAKAKGISIDVLLAQQPMVASDRVFATEAEVVAGRAKRTRRARVVKTHAARTAPRKD